MKVERDTAVASPRRAWIRRAAVVLVVLAVVIGAGIALSDPPCTADKFSQMAIDYGRIEGVGSPWEVAVMEGLQIAGYLTTYPDVDEAEIADHLGKIVSPVGGRDADVTLAELPGAPSVSLRWTGVGWVPGGVSIRYCDGG